MHKFIKKMDFNFKKEFSLEKRIKDYKEILKDYPNRIPVICERAPNAKFQIITKTKYLCPLDMTVTQFTFLIRQKLNLPQGATIYFLTGDNVTLTGNQYMSEVYQSHKDKEDGFLYITYASEVFFG